MNIRNYAIFLVVIICVEVLLLMGFVVSTNPYDLYDIRPNQLTKNKYQVARYERIIKPAVVVKMQAKAINLGSSRAAVGIDPNDLARFSGLSAYNFGITGAYIDEVDAAMRHAVQQAGTKTVVIGLDYFAFTHERPKLVEQIEVMNKGSVFENFQNLARMTFSLKAIIDSLQTIRKNYLDLPANHTSLGLYVDFDPSGQEFVTPVDHKDETIEATYKTFEGLLEFAKSNDVELHLFISPTFHSHLRKGKNYLNWVARVTDIVSRHGTHVARLDLEESFTTNPELYVDVTHFKPILGARILERLFSNKKSVSVVKPVVVK
jgi:hypothetical protein